MHVRSMNACTPCGAVFERQRGWALPSLTLCAQYVRSFLRKRTLFLLPQRVYDDDE